MFFSPKEGWQTWVENENKYVYFDGSTWQALIPAQQRTLNLLLVSGTSVWTNLPASVTEYLNNKKHRVILDLSQFTSARFSMVKANAGQAGGDIRLQVSEADSLQPWFYLDGSAGPSITIPSTAGTFISSWVTLSTQAKTGQFFRIVGLSGTGSTSPDIGQIVLQCK